MWFAKLTDKNVTVNIDGNVQQFNIENCCYIQKTDNIFYFLNGKYLYLIFNKRTVRKIPMIDISSNKFIINEKIYVSGEESGAIFVYDSLGNALESFTLGEHVSDFDIDKKSIYAITYHDNSIIKTDFNLSLKIQINSAPQRIIVDKFIYVLSHDGFLTYISQYNKNLKLIKSISFQRQIGNLYKFFDKIVFNGSNYNYILSTNLNIISIKKSTGENLCRFSDIPIFESEKKLDIINNIIYP